MKEEAIVFGDDNHLIGIFTHAAMPGENAPVFIQLNAGMLHRVGPNRLSVKIAKALSEIGIPSFRFDFSGIGDSEYVNSTVSFEKNALYEINCAMDYLSSTYNISRFVLGGLCTGAELSLLAALQDERIVGICGMNGLYHDPENPQTGPSASYIVFRYYIKNVFNVKKYIKFIQTKTGQARRINFGQVQRKLAALLKPSPQLPESVKPREIKDQLQPVTYNKAGDNIFWGTLLARKAAVLLLYSEGSTAWDAYHYMKKKRTGVAKHTREIEVHTFRNVDHNFTPVDSQNEVLQIICKWMKAHFKNRS